MDDTVIMNRDRGNWYKGNLHCHSTESDGSIPPAEIARMYREKGYSFLAFSEHETYSHHAEFNAPGFLVIPAIERSVSTKDAGRAACCYHLHGIWGGLSEIPVHGTRISVPVWVGPQTAQSIIDQLHTDGYMAMFNHPVWSRNNYRHLEQVDGYFAVEVYNHGCEEENRTGHSEPHWDHVLRLGRKVWGVATDDNHNRNAYGETPRDWDSFGGWVMVNAPELTCSAVAEALRDGRFYSSTGPEIYEYGVRDVPAFGERASGREGKASEVYVECSPASRVYFLTYPGRGYSRRDPHGGTLTTATYRLKGDEQYVRAEVVDATGKVAWTNPVFFDGRGHR